MTVNKQFAQDGNALDDHMEQLLEVLVQLLEEPPKRLVATHNRSVAATMADLHSGDTGVIHVSVGNSPNQTELGSCQ